MGTEIDCMVIGNTDKNPSSVVYSFRGDIVKAANFNLELD